MRGNHIFKGKIIAKLFIKMKIFTMDDACEVKNESHNLHKFLHPHPNQTLLPPWVSCVKSCHSSFPGVQLNTGDNLEENV